MESHGEQKRETSVEIQSLAQQPLALEHFLRQVRAQRDPTKPLVHCRPTSQNADLEFMVLRRTAAHMREICSRAEERKVVEGQTR